MEEASVLVNFLSGPQCSGDKSFEVMSSRPVQHAGLWKKDILVLSDAKTRVGEKLETLITDKMCGIAGSSLQRGEISSKTMNRTRI